MKILLFSDYHGAVEQLKKLPKAVSEYVPEIAVFCGDIVKGFARGNEWLASINESRKPDRNLQEIAEETSEDLEMYKNFYDTVGGLKIPIYVIPGNMDAPKTRYQTALEKAMGKYSNIYSIHKNHAKYAEFTITGFGGEITESEKEDFFVARYDKNDVIEGLYKSPRNIYATHSPPVCNKVDLDKTVHKGCSVLNDVLESLRPLAHFCGHAHNGRGTEKIGKTIIINPGAFKNGNFAIVDIDPDSKQINVQFKNTHLLKM